MCWGFICKIINGKGQVLIKEIDNIKKITELCKEIGADVPPSIADAVVSEQNTCLCSLTKQEKQIILGKTVSYALNKFHSIEISWL